MSYTHRDILEYELRNVLIKLAGHKFPRVLEIGAGNHSMESLIREFNPECVYCTVDNGDQYENPNNNKMDAHDLNKLTDNSFDLVVMSHTAEHFTNPVQAWKEIFRVLKSGGRVISITPYPCQYQILKGDPDHLYVLDTDQWIRILAYVGFRSLQSYVQMIWSEGQIPKAQDYNIFTIGVKP